jgi:hypothetical protein
MTLDSLIDWLEAQTWRDSTRSKWPHSYIVKGKVPDGPATFEAAVRALYDNGYEAKFLNRYLNTYLDAPPWRYWVMHTPDTYAAEAHGIINRAPSDKPIP